MFNRLFLLVLVLFPALPGFAQHEHHNTGAKQDTTKPAKSATGAARRTVAKDTAMLKHMHGDTSMRVEEGMDAPMTHAFSLSLPMSRNSSGTAWQPDATPMYGYMKMTKNWNLMFHSSVFLRYNHQDIFNKGVRSDSLTDRFDAPNWVMVMANRRIKKRGLLALSVMLSADELVMGGNGYPLLFQSGESFNGKPLVDRQHPHDLVSGLSAAYTHMINKDIDLTVYLGYPGEPAIGPPAFMHRISSMNNPDAPLGHHWQDATHIVFGVATLGLRYKILKFEFSNFTGREPGENRYNFDKPRFDSWSYRFLVNPTDNFAIQFSQAFIKSPEAVEPEENTTRTTASILHSVILGEKRHLTSSVVWGMNQLWEHRPEHSILLESNLQINKTAVYGRYEAIQKSAHELKIDQQPGELYLINALTAGASYNFLHAFNTNFRIGVQGSTFIVPSKLHALYGKLPLSAEIYIHVLPINMNALKRTKTSTTQNHSNH
jgi:hypothetical protein